MLNMAAKPQNNSIERRSARSTAKAFAASVGLSILFLIVYGGCIWITSRRGHVGSLYFEWERRIPFVPFFILPYMSIDLFFIAAPFLCRSDRELETFSKRVTLAILIAGVCFLLLPLRFAFARPEANGWLGALFDWFRAMDAPYNLLPSLHAALCLLLVDVYARNFRGAWRIAALAWFVFIGVSPLLTYQHHVIDIAGGFILAGYCFYLFRDSSPSLSFLPSSRIGSYYVAGAIVSLVLAIGFWPWSGFLIWPATALGIVASAYFGIGPVIFRKVRGRLPWSMRFVLGPYLFGQYLSLLYYRRRCRAWDEVTPGVWIGGRLSSREATKSVEAGVTSVLDLTAEFSETEALRRVRYRNIPILDLSAPTTEQLREMAEFIAGRSRDGVAYVHCKIGYSRSAAAVAAYLIMAGETSGTDEALDLLRRVRPSIVIRPEIVRALAEFERHCRKHEPAFS